MMTRIPGTTLFSNLADLQPNAIAPKSIDRRLSFWQSWRLVWRGQKFNLDFVLADWLASEFCHVFERCPCRLDLILPSHQALRHCGSWFGDSRREKNFGFNFRPIPTVSTAAPRTNELMTPREKDYVPQVKRRRCCRRRLIDERCTGGTPSIKSHRSMANQGTSPEKSGLLFRYVTNSGLCKASSATVTGIGGWGLGAVALVWLGTVASLGVEQLRRYFG